MTWFGISATYLRFYAGLKAQGISRANLPYASKLQPFAAWYALIACFVVCFVRFTLLHKVVHRLTHGQFSGFKVFLRGHWDTATFVTNYLPLMLFPVLYIGAKLYYKDPVKPSHSMDFVSDIKEIEAMTYVLSCLCLCLYTEPYSLLQLG